MAMTGAGLQDWVFWLTGALLVLAGPTLAAWALFWDRARGRKRCPECWYDMSAAAAMLKDGREGFVCPECGRTSERRFLLKVRRRWRLAITGGALFGAGLWTSPFLREGLWVRCVPSALLVETVPLGTDLPEWCLPLWNECEDRYIEDELSRSHLERLWERAARVSIRTRDRWPEGTSLVAIVVLERCFYGAEERAFLVQPRFAGASHLMETLFGGESAPFDLGWDDDSRALGVPPTGMQDLVLDLELWPASSRDGPPVWKHELRRMLEVSGRIDDVIAPVRSAALDDEVKRGVVLSLSRPRRTLRLNLTRPPGETFASIALAPMVEFIHRGEPVAWARCWFGPGWFSNPARYGVQVEGDADRLLNADRNDPAWSVRVRGDGEMALRDFDKDRYWAGEFIVPLSAVGWPGES